MRALAQVIFGLGKAIVYGLLLQFSCARCGFFDYVRLPELMPKYFSHSGASVPI